MWVEDHPRPPGLTSDLPAQTDFLVVGSGLTGLSTALRLAEAGREVAVIDLGEIAGGASSINGGMVSPDVKAGIRAVLHAHGPQIADEMWAATVRSVELVRQLSSRPGIDALTHQGGLAALGWTRRQHAQLSHMVSWYRDRFSVDWEILEGPEVQRVVGGDYFNVALYEPEGIGIHPARLSFGLAAELVRRGGLLIDHCQATSVGKSGAGFEVDTSKGAVRTGQVVLATNGYTGRAPSRDLARRVVPVGSYIIVTEPLAAPRAETILPGGVMAYTRRRLLNYMRRTPDDRILLGGRRNLHPGLDLAESASDLTRKLLTFWPELSDVEITHVWGGRLGVPFDLTPHIGRVDGAWYALGYAGHGVGLAVQLGHELAGMLLGEDPPSVFSRIPHHGRFYYRGGFPWFLTPASYLYRVLDRLGR